MSSKPHEAAPSRLARARRDGDHPLSHDAVTLAAFAGALLACVAAGPLFAGAARELVVRGAAGGVDAPAVAALAVAPAATAVGGVAGAILATVAQTNGLGMRAPRLQFERLSPGAGLKRAFGREAAIGAARGVAAIALTLALLAAFLSVPSAELFSARTLDFAVALTWRLSLTAVAIVVATGAILAAADVGWSRFEWRQRLRMTHDELRRELRENDGDPETRTRRRRLHRTLVRGSVHELRRASFVVVNPAHVAVALRYAPPETPVPAILVRALDEGALRVKALAREAAVPLIEDVVLARALYAHGALGPIPSDLYVAVAQIVASLQRQALR